MRGLRLPAALGALEGLVLAVVGVLVASPLLVRNVTAIEGGPRDSLSAIELSAGQLVIATVVASVLFGVVVALVARLVPPLFRPDLSLPNSLASSLGVGAVLGGVFGVVAGGLVALAGREEGVEALVIQTVPALILALIAGAAFGALTTMAVYGVADPEDEAAAEEAVRIRSRVVSSFVVPLVAGLVLLVLVVAMGLLFLEFHDAAPLLGIVIAGGILAFGSLVAARPGKKGSISELVIAFAGVGLVVLVIALVVLQQSSGGHG